MKRIYKFLASVLACTCLFSSITYADAPPVSGNTRIQLC